MMVNASSDTGFMNHYCYVNLVLSQQVDMVHSEDPVGDGIARFHPGLQGGVRPSATPGGSKWDLSLGSLNLHPLPCVGPGHLWGGPAHSGHTQIQIGPLATVSRHNLPAAHGNPWALFLRPGAAGSYAARNWTSPMGFWIWTPYVGPGHPWETRRSGVIRGSAVRPRPWEPGSGCGREGRGRGGIGVYFNFARGCSPTECPKGYIKRL